MQSFINLGWKRFFFNFVTSFFPDQGHLRSKVKVPNGIPVMTSYLKVNSNYMPIWYCFQDIGPFNNLLIKLINLISMI